MTKKLRTSAEFDLNTQQMLKEQVMQTAKACILLFKEIEDNMLSKIHEKCNLTFRFGVIRLLLLDLIVGNIRTEERLNAFEQMSEDIISCIKDSLKDFPS